VRGTDGIKSAGQTAARAETLLDRGRRILEDLPLKSETLDELYQAGKLSMYEAGANDQWLPGGFLPSGAHEAVLDGAKAKPTDYAIRNVDRNGF
jgi:hypothetical protein